MKVVKDCKKCRENLYVEQTYEVFSSCVDSAASCAAAIAIATLEMEHKSPEEIRQFFEDYCFIAGLSEYEGKLVTAENFIKEYAKKYSLDFNKIEVHKESKIHFMGRYRRCK